MQDRIKQFLAAGCLALAVSEVAAANAAKAAPPWRSASPNKYDENERYLTARSGSGAIRFETDKGRIGKVYAGRWAQVQYVEGCL